MNLFKQFFYRCYSSNMKSWKEQGPAASQALAEICALVTMNLYALLTCYDLVLGTRVRVRVLELYDSSSLLVILLGLATIWTLFFATGYFKKLVREMEFKEAEGSHIVTERTRRIYEAVSVILLFISLMIPIAGN